MDTQSIDTPSYPMPFSPARRQRDDEIGFMEYWYAIVYYKWLIGFIALFMLALGAVYAWTLEPVYRVSTMLQLESRKIGMEGLDDISELMGAGNVEALAQLEIIRSRLVVGKTVDKLQLDVTATPNWFPIIGRAMYNSFARGYAGPGISPAPLWGLDRFAWGGEHIRVTTFRTTPAYQDTPLRLVAGEADAYRLYGEDGALLLQGVTGTQAEIGIDGMPVMTLLVGELRARPGTEFILMQRNRNTVVRGYQGEIDAAEKSRDTGILEVSLEGTDPRRTIEIIDTLVSNYIEHHIHRKTQEVAQMLAFVEDQLPSLKADLDAAEETLASYHGKYGGIDIGLETTALLKKLSELEKQLFDFNLLHMDYKREYTEGHRDRVALEQKIERLRQERDRINRQIESLPEAERVSVGVMRDFETANEIYSLFLTKAQELRIAEAGITGGVYVVDKGAMPDRPIKPRKSLIMLVAVMLGLFLGVLFASIRKTMHAGIDSPDIIEESLGLPVYALIPHSPQQDKLARGTQTKTVPLLASHHDNDPTTEGLRSLRTSLQFSRAGTERHTICLSAPISGAGKSFLAANLSHVLAAVGKKVVLIDADLRKGNLHYSLGEEKTPGLAEFLRGEAEYEQILRQVNMGAPAKSLRFGFIPTGENPPNPAELLANERFEWLITTLREAFDSVVLDTPPIMAVTDAAIIGRLADINLLVIRADRQRLEEAAFALKRLRQAGAKVQGAIFNDISPRTGYGGVYYKYGYSGDSYKY